MLTHVLLEDSILAIRRRWAAIPAGPARMARKTWQATSGSGAVHAINRIPILQTMGERISIPLGIVCCVAARGSTIHGSRARPPATGTTGALSGGSGWLARGRGWHSSKLNTCSHFFYSLLPVPQATCGAGEPGEACPPSFRIARSARNFFDLSPSPSPSWRGVLG